MPSKRITEGRTESCIDCGAPIWRDSLRCRPCAGRYRGETFFRTPEQIAATSMKGAQTKRERAERRYKIAQPRCEACGQPIPFKRDWEHRRFCSLTCTRSSMLLIKPRIKGGTCPGCGKLRRAQDTGLCLACGGTRKTGDHMWTLEQVAYLRERYPLDGSVATAKALGLTVQQVYGKANALKIKLSDETRARVVHEPTRKRMTATNPMHKPANQQKAREWHLSHPEGYQRLMAGQAKLQRDKPSKPELRLREMLTDLGICFEPSAAIKKSFIVDIRIGNLIIELDGDYWHGHPRFYPLSERQQRQQKRDRSRDKYLKACEYVIERIWECELTIERVRSILIRHHAVPEPDLR